MQAQDSQEEREMQTDDDCPQVKSSAEKMATDIVIPNTDSVESTTPKCDVQNDPCMLKSETANILIEASKVPLPPDLDASFSDVQEVEETEQKGTEDPSVGNTTKRKRRTKRYKLDDDGIDISDMPVELQGEPKMIKYWKKRHSLFHR